MMTAACVRTRVRLLLGPLSKVMCGRVYAWLVLIEWQDETHEAPCKILISPRNRTYPSQRDGLRPATRRARQREPIFEVCLAPAARQSSKLIVRVRFPSPAPPESLMFRGLECRVGAMSSPVICPSCPFLAAVFRCLGHGEGRGHQQLPGFDVGPKPQPRPSSSGKNRLICPRQSADATSTAARSRVGRGTIRRRAAIGRPGQSSGNRPGRGPGAGSAGARSPSPQRQSSPAGAGKRVARRSR